jgi:hypothetical protein
MLKSRFVSVMSQVLLYTMLLNQTALDLSATCTAPIPATPARIVTIASIARKMAGSAAFANEKGRIDRASSTEGTLYPPSTPGI